MDGPRISASSFRDPSGFVFSREGVIYRQVNLSYRRHYDHLMASGLYADLTARRLLVSHTEVDLAPANGERAYKVLQPKNVPFISYPYEWSFSQLKDAALVTLDIQRRALAHGMALKDASAYNIQFLEGAPRLIDTLSFEVYQEGRPWAAYRQFCQHFLAPLALMSYQDVRLSQLLNNYIDGIPLDLAARLLPVRARLNLGILMHVHLHARAQRRYEKPGTEPGQAGSRRLEKPALQNIVDNLRSTVRRLRWRHDQTAWAGYYDGDSYEAASFRGKVALVSEFIEAIKPKTVWDLGANTGEFSRISSQSGRFTLSIDSDPGVVEANYLRAKRDRDKHLLPLLIDLANPSAAIGWANQERESLVERSKADCVLALALIHHIAIGNNVPLYRIAEFLARLAPRLIVEFVPKSDKQVRKLLSSREDIFEGYTQAGFERSFGRYFKVAMRARISRSERTLYLMHRLENCAP